MRCCPTDRRGLLRGIRLVLVAGLGTLACGCGGDKLHVTSVKGKVTFQGKPLQFGSVLFQPVGKGLPARGEIQSDGTFVLGTYSGSDGAVVGKHKVRITCNDTQNPDYKLAPGEEGMVGKSLIPEKYTRAETSGLTADVTEGGDNDFPFDLLQ